MTIDRNVETGLPEINDPRFKTWLQTAIKGTYKKMIKHNDDSILVESYISQMHLYEHLYGICYIGSDGDEEDGKNN